MTTQTEAMSAVLSDQSVLSKLVAGPLLLVEEHTLAAVLLSPLQWNAILAELLELRRQSNNNHSQQIEQLIDSRWDQLFEQSQDTLAGWALEALSEDEAGLTESLDTFFASEKMAV